MTAHISRRIEEVEVAPMLLKRNREEVDLIVTEMGSYLASLQKELQHLEKNIRTIYTVNLKVTMSMI